MKTITNCCKIRKNTYKYANIVKITNWNGQIQGFCDILDFFIHTKNQKLVFCNARFVEKSPEMNVSRRLDNPRYPVFDFR